LKSEITPGRGYLLFCRNEGYAAAKGRTRVAHLPFKVKRRAGELAVLVLFGSHAFGDLRNGTLFKFANRFRDSGVITRAARITEFCLSSCCYCSRERISRALLLSKLSESSTLCVGELRGTGDLLLNSLSLYCQNIVECSRLRDALQARAFRARALIAYLLLRTDNLNACAHFVEAYATRLGCWRGTFLVATRR
jgi:hypothetical protein